ncbi:hypothetical protein [Methylomonas albis]|uniref:Uncharacterized protein n=1 Tax=Methylomonas albis TaxID=1854563 RepID=A0ABR9D698_9GAMM|nr:hypothetical protein [Methylomonas albis]MBD9357744.1 hypothetical protein [Methylomonas albis]CAD6881061.1 hypothetical protein [Methylomonas albis]
MFFLGILADESFAAEIQSVPIYDNSEQKDEKKKHQLTKDIAKDSLDAVAIKKDINKILGQELNSENSMVNVAPHESIVEIPSISHAILREREYMNRPAQISMGAQEFFYAIPGVNTEKYDYSEDVFSYKNLLDEVLNGLSDEAYSKLVWTYYDLKDFDDSIYANMVSYDLRGTDILGRLQRFIGVDEQVSAMMVFGNSIGAMEGTNGVVSGHGRDSNKSANSKVVLDFSQRSFAKKEEIDISRFEYILKHLTIKNIIYSLLSLMGAGMVWRMFRFFIRQDLS